MTPYIVLSCEKKINIMSVYTLNTLKPSYFICEMFLTFAITN